MSTSARQRRPRLALSVPNMADAAQLVELGVRAESNGWDGVFFWDHAHGGSEAPVPTVDPWVLLGALAVKTSRITIGTAITAPARRRPQKLARETVTVDHLSDGRLVLGVGLGEPPAEYEAYGESAEPKLLAAKLDEFLTVLTEMWSGEAFDHHGEHYTVEKAQFLPTPVQQPRIPIWCACVLPHTRPLERAARYDGVILASIGEGGSIDPLPPGDVAAAVEAIRTRRGDGVRSFDVAVAHPSLPSDEELGDLGDAGATWVMCTGWVEDLDALVDLADRSL